MDKLEKLIEKLGDQNWEIRKAAVHALGETRDKRALEPLIKSLGDVSYYVREAVVEALERIDPSWAKTEEARKQVPRFIKALKDEDWRVRRAACLALGKLGDKRAVKHILFARTDKNVEVSRAALSATIKIGEPAIETLINILRDKNVNRRVRITACIALGEIGDKRAVEPLANVLNENSATMCSITTTPLGKIEDKRSVEPVIKDEDCKMRVIGLEAMGEIEDVETFMEDKDYEMRVRVVEALGKIGDESAIRFLINALENEDEFVCRDAAKALGKIGDRRAVEPLIKALNNRKLWGWIRIEAARALGRIGDKRAVGALVNALKEQDATMRSIVAKALGKIGDKRAVEPLINALWDTTNFPVLESIVEALNKIDPDWSKSETAKKLVSDIIIVLNNKRKSCWDFKRNIWVLGEIGDKRALKPLIRILKKRKDYKIRASAARALSKIGKPAIEPLLKLLRSKNSEVRMLAAEALADIGDPAVDRLIDILENIHSDIRKEAAQILGEIGNKRAIEPLIKALGSRNFGSSIVAIEALDKIDPDWSKSEEAKKLIPLSIKAWKDGNTQSRESAVWVLGTLGDERVVEHLINALKDNDKYVRKAAVYALGEIGDKRAVEPLIKVLECDNNSDVRKAAVHALGELRDERAVKPLTNYLRCWGVWIVCNALAKIGKPAVETLITALQDRDPVIRMIAAEALGKIGDKRAVEPLINLLEDEEVKIVAAEALGKIGDKRAINPLIKWALEDNYFAITAFKALGEIGKPAIEPLIEVLVKSEDWDITKLAKKTLKEIDPNWSEI